MEGSCSIRSGQGQMGMLWDGYWRGLLEGLVVDVEDPSTGCFLGKRRIWAHSKTSFAEFPLTEADTVKGEWLKEWLGWRSAGSVSKMDLSCQVQSPQDQRCGEGCALLLSAGPR